MISLARKIIRYKILKSNSDSGYHPNPVFRRGELWPHGPFSVWQWHPCEQKQQTSPENVQSLCHRRKFLAALGGGGEAEGFMTLCLLAENPHRRKTRSPVTGPHQQACFSFSIVSFALSEDPSETKFPP